MGAPEEGPSVDGFADVSGLDESNVEDSGPDELSDGSKTELVGRADDGMPVVLENGAVACDKLDEDGGSTKDVEGKSVIL